MFILQGGSPFVYVCFNLTKSTSKNSQCKSWFNSSFLLVTSPFFIIFHHVSPCFTIFHHFSPCFTIFHHISPFFTMFHHFSPYFTMFPGELTIFSGSKRPPGGENPTTALECAGAARGNWWPLASSPHRCRTVRWPRLGPKKAKTFLVGGE